MQGGKDALFRLLDLGRLNGQGGAGNITGGELQSVKIAAGQFTAPVVWRTAGQTWVFVATGSSFQAFKLVSGRLQSAWTSPAGATSPVVAGGLLYAYDPDGSGLRVYRPTSGAIVARLPAGSGHWNSPIVTDGRIAIPEGNANDHALSGALDIYR